MVPKPKGPDRQVSSIVESSPMSPSVLASERVACCGGRLDPLASASHIYLIPICRTCECKVGPSVGHVPDVVVGPIVGGERNNGGVLGATVDAEIRSCSGMG